MHYPRNNVRRMQPDSLCHSKSKSSERSNQTHMHTPHTKQTADKHKLLSHVCVTNSCLRWCRVRNTVCILKPCTHAAAVRSVLSKVLEVCDFSLQMTSDTQRGKSTNDGNEWNWIGDVLHSVRASKAVSGSGECERWKKTNSKIFCAMCVCHEQRVAKLILLWFYARWERTSVCSSIKTEIYFYFHFVHLHHPSHRLREQEWSKPNRWYRVNDCKNVFGNFQKRFTGCMPLRWSLRSHSTREILTKCYFSDKWEWARHAVCACVRLFCLFRNIHRQNTSLLGIQYKNRQNTSLLNTQYKKRPRTHHF